MYSNWNSYRLSEEKRCEIITTATLLSEELEIVLRDAGYTNLKRQMAVLMEGEDNKTAAPDEGILIFDEDLDTEDGSDCYGNIIYERQGAIIEIWTTSRIDRQHIKDDIVAILNASSLHIWFAGMTPKNTLDLFGYEIRVRRIA